MTVKKGKQNSRNTLKVIDFSICVPKSAGISALKKALSFVGSAFLVFVSMSGGYVDLLGTILQFQLIAADSKGLKKAAFQITLKRRPHRLLISSISRSEYAS